MTQEEQEQLAVENIYNEFHKQFPSVTKKQILRELQSRKYYESNGVDCGNWETSLQKIHKENIYYDLIC